MTDNQRIMDLLRQAKALARDYRRLTGKPLGITGEVAEYEAARHLNLSLMPARQAGYDAVRKSDGRRYQIKGRCVLAAGKPSQRVGSIDVTKDFDVVLLVLLDENFNASTIYEVEKGSVLDVLAKPGSRSRNERGTIGVALFKRIGRKVWERGQTNQDDDPTVSIITM